MKQDLADAFQTIGAILFLVLCAFMGIGVAVWAVITTGIIWDYHPLAAVAFALTMLCLGFMIIGSAMSTRVD